MVEDLSKATDKVAKMLCLIGLLFREKMILAEERSEMKSRLGFKINKIL